MRKPLEPVPPRQLALPDDGGDCQLCGRVEASGCTTSARATPSANGPVPASPIARTRPSDSTTGTPGTSRNSRASAVTASRSPDSDPSRSGTLTSTRLGSSPTPNLRRRKPDDPGCRLHSSAERARIASATSEVEGASRSLVATSSARSCSNSARAAASAPAKALTRLELRRRPRRRPSAHEPTSITGDSAANTSDSGCRVIANSAPPSTAGATRAIAGRRGGSSTTGGSGRAMVRVTCTRSTRGGRTKPSPAADGRRGRVPATGRMVTSVPPTRIRDEALTAARLTRRPSTTTPFAELRSAISIVAATVTVA